MLGKIFWFVVIFKENFSIISKIYSTFREKLAKTEND